MPSEITGEKAAAHEGQVHFVTDLDQAVLDDGQGDGIEVGHGSND